MGTTNRLLGALLFVLFVAMLFAAIIVTGGVPIFGVPGGIELLFILWLVIPLVLVLGLVVLLVRVFSDNRDTAMEELREAYARGELSDEEFEHRREKLQRK